MAVSNSTKIAATIGFLGAMAAVAAGVVSIVSSPSGDSTSIPWQTPPVAPKCMKLNVLADRSCLATFGMTPRDGRENEYVRVTICGEATTESAAPSLPSCVTPLYDTEEEVPYASGMAQITAEREDIDDESPCACASTASCEMLAGDPPTWQPAPKGLTLGAGMWRGDCKRKTCVEASGFDSMPSECK